MNDAPIAAFLASSALLAYVWATSCRAAPEDGGAPAREPGPPDAPARAVAAFSQDSLPPAAGDPAAAANRSAPEASQNPAAEYYRDLKRKIAELRKLAEQEAAGKKALDEEFATLSARARNPAEAGPARSDLRQVQERLAELEALAAQQASREKSILKRLAELAQQAMTVPAAAKPPDPASPENKSAAPAQPPAAGALFRPASARKKPRNGAKSVLVCDNDETLVELLEILFKTAGYGVLTALDGRECLKVLESCDPDLMIIGLDMPVKNGFEVIEELAGCGELGRRPFFALSAQERKPDIERVKSLGAQDCLVKPFDAEALMRRVKELLPA